MRLPLLAFLLCAGFQPLAFAADSTDSHLLYLATPDGAQHGNDDFTGVRIFDIDHGHKLVRRFEMPIFSEGVRGFCPNAQTHRAFYSTTNHTLGCLDLETDQVVWEKKY